MFEHHEVIYTLIDSVKAKMSALLPPDIITRIDGEANVLQIFTISLKKGKSEMIAGCKIATGKITRSSIIRVLRRDAVIHQGTLKTFKHHKKDIFEASKGLECGMAIESFADVAAGDTIQAITLIEKKRTI